MLRSDFRLPLLPVVIALLIAAIPPAPAWAWPFSVYVQPAYESPLRGDPDDLLLISGIGLSAADTVVYQAIGDTTQVAQPPASVPTSSTATQGVADLVSAADAPYSLTVHLPAVMTAGHSYALWVVTPDGRWSTELRINDARPLWITPDSSYQTASLANLPRRLKVVGRNLQPDPNATGTTQVRLVGVNTGTTYLLTANNVSNDPKHTTAALERYVAAVNLPSAPAVDQYSVQVSRDGTSWVPLLGNGQSPPQTFAVVADPVAPTPATTFNVSDPQFADPLTGNPCQPNDGIDDTGCIILAIRAAQMAGGGTVTFGPGTWLLANAGTWAGQAYSNRIGYQAGYCPGYPETCGVSYFGVTVPPGVSLQGAGPTGSSATVMQRAATWLTGSNPMPAFVLQGNNVVSGIEFQDAVNYASGAAGEGELQLGYAWYFATIASPTDPLTVSNVVITNNLFVQPYIGIVNGGLPIDHLYVTDNTFGGAYLVGMSLVQSTGEAGNLEPGAGLPYQTYHFDDTIVDHNIFYPSSYAQTVATFNGGGSIASEINTGLRADFSDNVADGTVTQYLYNPSTDPKGWRAAYFFSTGANREMTLVSNNVATCPGDKVGDGEGIAYDGGTTQGGMPAAQPVIAAVPWTDPAGIHGTTLTIQGAVLTTLQDNNGNPFSIAANPTLYYQGFWVQVVQGTGKGQWRKMESMSLGTNSTGSTVTLNVTPAFDVPPDATSEVVLDHAYWQNATVNNYIDQRTPLCTQANPLASGGLITWYQSTADSAIEGNRQYATNGILVRQVYLSEVNPVGLSLQSVNEVRNNLIDGSYNWSDPNSDLGGIQLGYGAYYCGYSTCVTPIPPVLGYGISIARNTIIQDDGKDGDDGANGNPPIGAIGLGAGWSTGPIDSAGLNEWQLGDATLVFHNTLQNISDTAPGSIPGVLHIGIGVDNSIGSSGYPPTSAVTWRTAMYANTCSNVDIPLSDLGLGSARYCPSGATSSCECSGIASVDVGIAANGAPGPLDAGSSLTYTATITNNSSTAPASDVSVFLQPSAGVQLIGESFNPSQGSCDGSVNVCSLGSVPAGATATVSVNALLLSVGKWPVTFSVTHSDADTVSQNDSAVVIEVAQ
jgi:Domain of unknown function DUF11